LFVPLMLARRLVQPLHRAKGSIVNITSIAGHAIHPFAGSAYSTSKAALSALTREMAVEFAELGVRVNAVAPGEIEPAMIGPEYETLMPRIPMHRMGKPEGGAGAAYQLCSSDSSYVTGRELFLSGGQHVFGGVGGGRLRQGFEAGEQAPEPADTLGELEDVVVEPVEQQAGAVVRIAAQMTAEIG